MPDKKFIPTTILTINARIFLNTRSYQKFFFPLVILYLGALIFCILVLVFPGAKIFYKTIQLGYKNLMLLYC